MTLDKAIKHCEEVAEEQDMKAGFETDYQTYTMSETERERCRECANEHRQLAEWLKELKAWRTFGLRVGEIISLYLPDDMVAELLKTLNERSGGAE